MFFFFGCWDMQPRFDGPACFLEPDLFYPKEAEGGGNWTYEDILGTTDNKSVVGKIHLRSVVATLGGCHLRWFPT